MGTRTPLDQHILDLLEQNGEMCSRDIYATKPEMSINTIRGCIGRLKNGGKIEKVQNGIYRKSALTDLLFDEIHQLDRRALDAIIFDALGLTEGERDGVCEAVVNLVEARLRKARSLKGKI